MAQKAAAPESLVKLAHRPLLHVYECGACEQDVWVLVHH